MARTLLGSLFFVACSVAFAVGVVSNRAWLTSECARLEPWKLPIIWAPMAAALLLFVEHGASRISGIPLNEKARRFTLKAFLVAAACDAAFAGYSVFEDASAHSRAVSTQGELVWGRSRMEDSIHRRYTFTCSFRDFQGQQHFAWFSDIADGVPNDVRQGIDLGRKSTAARISYDPTWPGRHWLADVPYSQDNRLFLFTFMSLIFAIPIAALLWMGRRHWKWFPAPSVAPFLAAAAMLCLAAAIQGW